MYLVAAGIEEEDDGHQPERPVVPEDLYLVGPVGETPIAEVQAAALEVGVDEEAVLLLLPVGRRLAGLQGCDVHLIGILLRRCD